MIDLLAIVLTHGLMLLACWLLLGRDDLDREGGPGRERWRRTRER